MAEGGRILPNMTERETGLKRRTMKLPPARTFVCPRCQLTVKETGHVRFTLPPSCTCDNRYPHKPATMTEQPEARK